MSDTRSSARRGRYQTPERTLPGQLSGVVCSTSWRHMCERTLDRMQPELRRDRLWDVHEVARYLGVHEKTVYAWVSSLELPSIHVGRRVRFSPDDILRWVSARRREK